MAECLGEPADVAAAPYQTLGILWQDHCGRGVDAALFPGVFFTISHRSTPVPPGSDTTWDEAAPWILPADRPANLTEAVDDMPVAPGEPAAAEFARAAQLARA